MKKGTKKSVRDNLIFPIVASVVSSGIITFIGTQIYDEKVKYVEYIPFDNVSVLIENDFVDTGLVDASVLDLEKPAEQFSMIAESILEQKNMIEGFNQKNEELSGTISALKQ